MQFELHGKHGTWKKQNKKTQRGVNVSIFRC